MLAAAGLPILGRYLLLPATIGAILCGAGAFGWMALPREHARRRPWAWFGLVTIVLLVVFAPAQVDRIDALRDALARQAQIQDDLRALVRAAAGAGHAAPACRSASPTTARSRCWRCGSTCRPKSCRACSAARSRAARTCARRRPQVAADYILDRRDLRKLVPQPPAGFALAGGNESWLVFERCPAAAR